MARGSPGGTGGERARRQAGVKVGADTPPSCRGSADVRAARPADPRRSLALWNLPRPPLALNLGGSLASRAPHCHPQHPSQSLARLADLCPAAHPCL